MSNDKMDSTTVYAMFEELKESNDKLSATVQKVFAIPANVPNSEQIERLEKLTANATNFLRQKQAADHAELKSTLDAIGQQVGELKPAPQEGEVTHTHHHTLDFMSNWALIGLAVAVSAFIVSLFVIDHQRDTIARSRDNDLKYRYIQMRGEATPTDIARLREIFDFNRNPDSIHSIRRQVEKYEQLAREQAEQAARAKLNAAEAEKLKRQAERVKGMKKK